MLKSGREAWCSVIEADGSFGEGARTDLENGAQSVVPDRDPLPNGTHTKESMETRASAPASDRCEGLGNGVPGRCGG
jgi:hypothetical protein